MSGAEDYTLVIGSRQASSWSLRPWLLMRQAGIPFKEILVALRRPETKAELAQHSPSSLVPALKVGTTTIWDSLAIAEFLNERHPDKALWPADPMTRAIARSVAAEMHSGFRDLRFVLPFNVYKRDLKADITSAVAHDIRRIVRVWKEIRSQFGKSGPFLFGDFSIADSMYAPVASRFTSYGINLADYGDDGLAASYRDAIMAMPAVQEWSRMAESEPTWPDH